MGLVTLLLAALACVCSGRTLRNGTHTSISSLVEELSKDVSSLVDQNKLEEEEAWTRSSAKRPEAAVFNYCSRHKMAAPINQNSDTDWHDWSSCRALNWMTRAVAEGSADADERAEYQINLQDFQIIGSHDAQSYPTSYQFDDSGVNIATPICPSSLGRAKRYFAEQYTPAFYQGGVAHSLDVGDQLRCGVRFLDIRLAWHAPEGGVAPQLITHHSLRNEAAHELFVQIVGFLDDLQFGDKEVVFVRLVLKTESVSNQPDARTELAQALRDSGLGARALTRADFGDVAMDYDYTNHDIWGTDGMLVTGAPSGTYRRVVILDGGGVYNAGANGQVGPQYGPAVTMNQVLFKEQKGGKFAQSCCDLKYNIEKQEKDSHSHVDGWVSPDHAFGRQPNAAQITAAAAGNTDSYKAIYLTITAFLGNRFADPVKHYGSLMWGTYCGIRVLLQCMLKGNDAWTESTREQFGPQPAWCNQYYVDHSGTFQSVHLMMVDFPERMGVLRYAEDTSVARIEEKVTYANADLEETNAALNGTQPPQVKLRSRSVGQKLAKVMEEMPKEMPEEEIAALNGLHGDNSEEESPHSALEESPHSDEPESDQEDCEYVETVIKCPIPNPFTKQDPGQYYLPVNKDCQSTPYRLGICPEDDLSGYEADSEFEGRD